MTKPTAFDEKILIEKLKANNTSAFTAIFTKYYHDLVRFSYCFTKNADSAEELVQDVFLKLWENRETLLIHSSLKSYLLKAVQNSSLDWLRHQKIQNDYSTQVKDYPTLSANDTENYVLLTELESDFEKALNKIPAEYAGVFRMSRMEAMSYLEIAEKLGVSVRTIEVRMGKALNQLRLELKDYLFIGFILYHLYWFFNLSCSFLIT